MSYLAAELPKRHMNLVHSVNREEFEAAVKNLHERLPSLEDQEAIAEMMRVIAMVGDGHTRLRFEQALGRQGIYPLRLYWYKDGLFVQAMASLYEDLVGGKVLEIGKVAAQQALDAISKIVWRDNEMGVRAAAPTLISIPEILHAEGDSMAKYGKVRSRDYITVLISLPLLRIENARKFFRWKMRQHNPKQAIPITKPRSPRVASQDHQLLAQSEIFGHQ